MADNTGLIVYLNLHREERIKTFRVPLFAGYVEVSNGVLKKSFFVIKSSAE